MPSRDPRAVRSDGHAAAGDGAQFAPFAALRGYDRVVASRMRTPEERHELTDEEATELSRVVLGLARGDVVRVRHYAGGAYVWDEGPVTRLDVVARLIWVGERRIRLDDVRQMRVVGQDPASV